MNNSTSVDNTLWAIVTAAGIGRRMATELPKQYLPLLGKTVIEHTLDRLLAIDNIQGIVVALHPRDQTFTQLPIAANAKIHTVHGGAERSDSVLAALNSLQKKIKLSDRVLVHDAARCCVRVESITTLIIEAMNNDVGGILAIPASDTLKRIGDDQQIEFTIDRRHVWQAQTPQLFRYDLLREALQQALKKQLMITDEASALEHAGYQPKVVVGHTDNIKITHPEDLAIASTILQQQER